jgi:hypothetical protein
VAVSSMIDRDSILAASRYVFSTTVLPLRFLVNALLWDWGDGNTVENSVNSNSSESALVNLLVLRKLNPMSSMVARIESCDFGFYFSF